MCICKCVCVFVRPNLYDLFYLYRSDFICPEAFGRQRNLVYPFSTSLFLFSTINLVRRIFLSAFHTSARLVLFAVASRTLAQTGVTFSVNNFLGSSRPSFHSDTHIQQPGKWVTCSIFSSNRFLSWCYCCCRRCWLGPEVRAQVKICSSKSG